MTTKEAVNHYLQLRSLELAQVTLREYKVLLTRFCLFYGDEPLRDLEDSHVLHFLESKPVNYLAFNNYRRWLNAFFNWCLKRKIVKDNPVKYVEPRKPNRALGEKRPEEIPKALPLEMRREILSRFKLYASSHIYVLIAFLAATGARPIEALRLQRHNVHSDHCVLAETKTYVPRVLYFPQNLSTILKAHLESHSSAYVWPSPLDDREHLSYRRVCNVWRELVKDLKHPITQRKITMYMLRHSFATDLIGVVDANEASLYLGNSPESLRSYQHASLKHKLITWGKIKALNVFTA